MNSRRKSSLDGAHQHALGEVLLHERIHAQHGHHGDDGRRRLGGSGGNLLEVLEHLRRGRVLVVHQHQQAAHQQLDGVLRVVAQIQKRGHVVVPVAHDAEQREGGQHGLGQRQHNLEEDAHMARAVQARGFAQRLGDEHEEGLEHDDVVGGNRARNDHDPEGVDHAQLHDSDVVGNQAAAEEHGDGQQHRHEPAAAQRGNGQRIGHQRRGQKHDDRAHGGVLDGVPVVQQRAAVAQQRLIGLQREALGPQIHRQGLQLLRIAEGQRQHVQQRIEEHRREQNHDDDQNHVERGDFLSDHSVFPPFLRTAKSRSACRSRCWR